MPYSEFVAHVIMIGTIQDGLNQRAQVQLAP